MSVPAVQGAPSPIADQPLSNQDGITQIALACLQESALSLALGFAVACFTPTPAGLSLIVGAVSVQLAASIVFRFIGASEWLNSLNFTILTGFNAQLLIHEIGHTLGILSVYTRPQPKIHVYPFSGGLTQFFKTSLSPFGKQIGPAAATCLVIASGPAFTLLLSAALLTLGMATRETDPHLSKYLIVWGVFDFLNHAYYAYSALQADPSGLTHDFVHLSIFGLHPVAAAVSLIAIPIVIIAGMRWGQGAKPLGT